MQPQHKLDPQKRTKPPGFTIAKQGDPRCCAHCKHFDGRGTCMKFHYPVRLFNVSDAFELREPQPGSVVDHPPPAPAAPSVQVNVGVPGHEQNPAGA